MSSDEVRGSPSGGRAGRGRLRVLTRSVGTTALHTWVVAMVAIVLIAVPTLWGDELGRAYGIYALVVGGLAVLAVVVILVRGLMGVRRATVAQERELDDSGL